MARAGAINAGEVVDSLDRLVERSLAQYDPESGRYRMLGMMQQYAAEHASEEESATTRRRHATYYAGLCTGVASEFGASTRDVVALTDAEYENLRSALEFALEDPPSGGLAPWLSAVLGLFALVRESYGQGLRWLEEALRRAGAETPAVGRCHYCKGLILYATGRFDEAENSFRLGSEIFQRLGEGAGERRCLQWLVMALITRGDTQGGLDLLRRVLDLAREAVDEHVLTVALNTFGEICRSQGDFEAARAHYEESLERAGPLMPELALAPMFNLAQTSVQLGDPLGAERYFRQALLVSFEVGDAFYLFGCLWGLAYPLLCEERVQEAGALAGFAQRLQEQSGVTLEPGDAVVAESIYELGRSTDAEAWERGLAEGRALTKDQALQRIGLDGGADRKA